MKYCFYSLLHIAEFETTANAFTPRSFDHQMEIYVRNAQVLAASLQHFDCKFVLLTNDTRKLKRYLLNGGFEVEVQEIPCITNVPKGTKYFSAHFKLDVYRYFSTLPEIYCVYLDLDMVCVNPLPSSFLHYVRLGTPMYLDVSAESISVYGESPMQSDLSLVLGRESEGKWAGGEFLAGCSSFFIKLVQEIEVVLPSYISNMASLNHIGDETFVSAALENLRSNLYITDAGAMLIVGRYWNRQCESEFIYQNRFEFFKRCFLIHLPADKLWIANLPPDKVTTPAELLTKLEKRESTGRLSILYRRFRNHWLLKKMDLLQRHFLRKN